MRKNILLDYVIITLGCIIYSFSFVIFFKSNDLAMGGFTGLSQVINHFFPFIKIGTSVLVLNLPLLFIGFKKEGFKLLFSTFYTVFLSSFLIDLLSVVFTIPSSDIFLSCIFGSILLGISLGLIMQRSATTGGTELLARIIKHKIPTLSIGKVCLIIDVTVICIYAISFQKYETALYGILAMYICSRALDSVIYGSSTGKLAYIISDKNDIIKEELLNSGFGITVIDANGGHFGENKQILLCALKMGKIFILKKIIAKHDSEKAFLIVCDAKEVLGKGFADYTGIGL